MAVLFAVERYHRYTFGRDVTVNTDHEPLEAIFKKEISSAPARLRECLRLSKYDLNVSMLARTECSLPTPFPD